MAFEKAKEYLEGYGLADRIIVTEQSSATGLCEMFSVNTGLLR